jgi:hypothetical protein
MAETLEEVLVEICHNAHTEGIPICSTKIELYLLVDTRKDNLEPIVGRVEIDFQETMDEKHCLDFMRAIHFVTPISMIIIKRTPFKVYHVPKTEEFMKKQCGGC